MRLQREHRLPRLLHFGVHLGGIEPQQHLVFLHRIAFPGEELGHAPRHLACDEVMIPLDAAVGLDQAFWQRRLAQPPPPGGEADKHQQSHRRRSEQAFLGCFDGISFLEFRARPWRA